MAIREFTADPVAFFDPACSPMSFVVSTENEWIVWKRLVSVIFTIPSESIEINWWLF